MEQSIKSVLVKQSLAQQQPINNLQVLGADVAVFCGKYYCASVHLLYTAIGSYSKCKQGCL